VLGILWLYWIGSVLALVLGYLALRQIRKSNGWQDGRGLAIAGIVLGWVGVTVLAAVVLLVAAVSNEVDDALDELETTTTVALDSSPSPAPDVTARPPGEVVVLVADASGVPGAGVAQNEAIAGGGYQVLPLANAPGPVEATQVLAVPGFEADAAALAAAIGASPDAVRPIPDSPPVDLTGAHVLVLLGPDLAG
jgi:hypothetical protein